MELRYLCIGIITLCLSLGCAQEPEEVDDALLYKFNFEIPDIVNMEDEAKYATPTSNTNDKEETKCAKPTAGEIQEEEALDYSGLSPLQLINSMFSTISCSHRVEAYWTYDFCHGFYIKQYHEEREGINVQFQEYYLGRWSDDKQEKLTQKLNADRKSGIKFNTTKINNLNYPYLELDMDNGTLCDLNNEPRTTKIRYVCYPRGKNNIFSFKETSSCNYEAIILTANLCVHPAFTAKESKELPSKCFSTPTLSKQPPTLKNQDLKDVHITDQSNLDFTVKKDKRSPNVGKPQKSFKAMPLPSPENILDFISLLNFGDKKDPLNSIGNGYDRDTYKRLYTFLFTGCLLGAARTLRFEYCFGRHARLFHRDLPDTQVIFGVFNDELHRQWLKCRPARRLNRKAIGSENAIWHHFGVGSTCDKTGDLCQTDVKLICNPSMPLPMLTMALWEPKTCEFIIVIESALVCLLMEMVDDDGIITKEGFRRFLYQLVQKRLDEVASEKFMQEVSSASVGVMQDVSY